MQHCLVGTPFLVKDFGVKRSVYSFAPTWVSFVSGNSREIFGHAVALNRRCAGQAAIGELMERYASSVRSPSLHSYTMPGFNLATNETVDLSLSQVLYANPQTLFSPEEIPESFFNDSVGGACHMDSPQAIHAAWREFMERQSLIYSWLTRTPGRRIPTNELDSGAREMFERLSGFFREIYVFDISLHPAMCVALILGIGETFMSIGASAGWKMTTAVNSALREALSQVMNYFPQPRYTWKYESGSSAYERIDEQPIKNGYARNYYDNYNPSLLREAYSYLIDESPCEPRLPNDTVGEAMKAGHRIKAIVDICAQLNVEPIIVRIPAAIEHPPIRVLKMTSVGAYPHMSTDLLTPEDYAISFHKGKVEFPNRGKLIPFP